MASSTLRIGLIGTGGIMRGAHMPGWTSAKDVQISAICDADQGTAERFAKDFGIPANRVFTDYHKLLEISEIDAVDVATPNLAHPAVVISALHAGKHVLCEKPLAVTTNDVLAMTKASRAAKKLLMTAQHQRWTPRAISLKRYIDTGALGDVYYARIHAIRRNWCPTSPNFIDAAFSGGGPCMDIGVHALDLGLWLMGFPVPARVTGTTRVNFAKGHVIPGAWGEWDRSRFTVEDFASGFIHFANGATMVLEASWLQHQREKEDFSARLYGSKASIHWPSGEFATSAGAALLDGVIEEAPGIGPAHSEEIHAFIKAIRSGAPSPVPVEETLHVIAILEAIVRSSQSGKEVVLDLPSAAIPASPSTSATAKA